MLSVQHKRVRLQTGRVGVISDTHGLLRPEAVAALKGSEVIIHAGDIGKSEVITSLESIAPVIGIRGNNDRDLWARKLPDILDLTVNGTKIYVLHNVNELEIDPTAKGICAVISGHSHKPGIARHATNILFLNPGSAGPRRFRLPITVAQLRIHAGKVNAKIVLLNI